MDLSVVESYSSSSSSHSKWKKYPVFMSFSGSDTRSGFTSHLEKALSQRGIDVFIDEKMPRGSDIYDYIFETIKKCSISIVIFSKNYIYSDWCMEELMMMIWCKDFMGKIVLPVFYKVRPSDIEEQLSMFDVQRKKYDFEKQLDERDVFTTREWRKALPDVTCLSGWVLKNQKEPDFIQKIVKDVYDKLQDMMLESDIADYSLGNICNQMQNINLRSNARNDDFIVIEVYGILRIRRDILAESFNNMINRKASRQSALVQRQEKQVYEILIDALEEGNLYRGINIVRGRRGLKILLMVLDHVDDCFAVTPADLRKIGMGSRRNATLTRREIRGLIEDGVTVDGNFTPPINGHWELVYRPTTSSLHEYLI